jgi:hypothetical protein
VFDERYKADGVTVIPSAKVLGGARRDGCKPVNPGLEGSGRRSRPGATCLPPRREPQRTIRIAEPDRSDPRVPSVPIVAKWAGAFPAQLT